MAVEQDLHWKRLLALRHWPAWLGMAILYTLSHLPFSWQHTLGARLGLLAMRILKSRRRIAAINLQLCFPELDAAAREQLLIDSFKMLGIGTLMSGLAWWGSERRIRKLICEVRGLEHVRQAQAQGRGIILLTAHFVTAEIGGRISSLLLPIPLNIMHRRQSSDVAEYVLQQARHRYIKEVILRANVRKMLRCLKSNEAIFYLPDQNFEQEHSIFVPFMGVNTLTLSATARFAKMNDCAVVPGFCFLREDGKGIDVEYFPALDNYPSGDEVTDTTRINQIFEQVIRKHPAQYMWLHRRFKIRPPGEASVY
ncbi:MAG: LpxL/LpxP family Kdo(2)-lipid IV(A) lauroyl/palmitoleoyl acyltransferase [Gammaproteobacteria bacterium]|nr:LpxL/LpxP family Kdo(2)-lipid IV(A) lauroyl/palmitoleoyl acyltransferase [Gammaproteobacteria bacterium]